MKLCEFENCHKEANYALYFMKPIFCKDHKKDNMKTKTCVCKCGKVRPAFGLITDKRPSCCKECRTDEMTNLYSKKCKCGKAVATFGLEKDNITTSCKDCKTDDMIYVMKLQKCKCNKTVGPSFGLSTDEKPTCCSKCRTSEMIDLKHKKCKCGKVQPGYGLEIDNKPVCCNECKTEEMIYLLTKKCKCGKYTPSYGYESDRIHICCSECKTNDMISLVQKKCLCGKSNPNFGLKTDTKALYCNLCRTPEMVDIIHKKCKSNYLDEDKKFECFQSANKKYKDYCVRCYAYHFPNDILTFQIRAKTKEIAVRDYINSQFVGFHHDKPLWISECECTHKRRVDHRKLIGNTLLCIETDENQHKYYKKEDEKARHNDLMMIHGGKFIFIRFNPDKYKENGKNKNPTIATRLLKLQDEINKQIKRIQNEENTELLEEIYLYYDN